MEVFNLEFTCVCGKSFKSQQSLKAHKSHCKVCLTPEQLERRKELYTEVGKRSFQYAQDSKIKKAEQWKKEGHICEQCGQLMEVKFGSGRFCSRSCSNKWVSLHQSDEAIKRKVEKGKGNLLLHGENINALMEYQAQFPKKEKIKTYKEKPSHKVSKRTYKSKTTKSIKKCKICGKELSDNNSSLLCKEHRNHDKIEEWLTYGTVRDVYKVPNYIRYYILEEQKGVCAICGQPQEWNGKPLIFICDHIDGNSNNNKRENLRLICPNCDTQLDTYKYKNKHSARTYRHKYI